MLNITEESIKLYKHNLVKVLDIEVLTNYDDKNIEDWYNFLGNIEEIIEEENSLEITNSTNSNVLNLMYASYDLFINSETELVIYIIMKEKNIKDNFKLIINNTEYKTYDDVLIYLKNLIKNI